MNIRLNLSHNNKYTHTHILCFMNNSCEQLASHIAFVIYIDSFFFYVSVLYTHLRSIVFPDKIVWFLANPWPSPQVIHILVVYSISSALCKQRWSDSEVCVQRIRAAVRSAWGYADCWAHRGRNSLFILLQQKPETLHCVVIFRFRSRPPYISLRWYNYNQVPHKSLSSNHQHGIYISPICSITIV